MRLRQIALVAKDLAATHAGVAAVLGLDYAYDDPAVAKYGLHNAVFPIGETFLEVVSPKEPGTTAGRLLEKRGGDGGYMVILQVDDIVEARSRVHAVGARIADQTDMDRAAFTHVHPKDIGGAILSLDSMSPKEHWEWGGPHWRKHVRTDTSIAIVGAELQGQDPEKMSQRWSAVLGRPRHKENDGWHIALDEGEIRFVPAQDDRGDGLAAFDVIVRDVEQVRARARSRGLLDRKGDIVLCGTRVHLIQA
jgi:catechol 2,3-dioxygenase-like lactoylglutathione lyase family enzyme